MLRLISWNVNGIRAAIKKGIWDSIDPLQPAIFAIQETKSDESIMLSEVPAHPKFDLKFHSCSMKKGYSGVATFSKVSNKSVVGVEEKDGGKEIFTSREEQNRQNNLPLKLLDYQIGLGNDKFDVEGRLVVTKYEITDPLARLKQFTLLNGYYPQGGRGPERIEYKIEFYQQVFDLANKLRQNGENVLLCGDLNTTVGDIDLARPKENKNTTGCLPEERAALDLFLKNGFVDTFRHFYPDKPDMYSYWDQITRARERNVGWRIDYFLADEKLMEFISDAYIWMDVMGSDHAPVGIDLDIY
jgi:exodeoxyribonuclease III